MVATPKPATASSSVRPARWKGGRCARVIAISSAPIEGAARIKPKPFRPDLEDIGGIDGQQRHRAAEQHGEHIQRDRGQDHFGVADETQPFGQRLPAWRLCVRAPGGRPLIRMTSHQESHAGDSIKDVDQGDVVHERHTQPGQRRADDRGQAARRCCSRWRRW